MGIELDGVKAGVFLRVQGKTVHCPLEPIVVPGIASADALDALDVVGQKFTIEVPRSGYILGARFYDLSDQGSGIRLHLFSRDFAIAASDAAWSPADNDVANELFVITFQSNYEDEINSQFATVLDVWPYSAPEEKFYCALSTPTGSTPTYTNPGMPRVQLIIASDDPNWEEK